MLNEVNFYCPKCGEYTKAELIDDILYADPVSPSIKCNCCSTRWRVEIYDVDEEDDK